jgi:phospholipid/cholesterol/gamma-HCH transport system substrate-binding protein
VSERLTERLRSTNRTTTIVATLVVVALLVTTVAVLLTLTSDKTGVAYFRNVKNIYPDDRVRIVGVDVGQITAIEPEPDRVKVTFSYDSSYSLPADVKAAVISPTLVSTRFLQLAPVLNDDDEAPELPDDGVIPLERTASPLEFDDLKKQISSLAKSLGPTAQDPQGALSRFLDVAAANGRGQGENFNRTVREASAALQTLADGREDFFGTIRNLQIFVSGLAAIDSQIVEFNQRLGDVSGLLDDNSGELAAALASVDRAAGLVDQFLQTNRDPLVTTVDQVGQLTRTLASQRDNLAQVLHVGPSTLMNLFNIYNPQSRALRGTLVVDNLQTPADLVCTAIANNTQSPLEAQNQCGQTLGPTLNALRQQQPPIGINPLRSPGVFPVPQPGVPEGNPGRPATPPANPLDGPLLGGGGN